MMKIPILLFTILILSSCATILTPAKYSVNINSNPSNIKYIVIDNRGVKILEGETPDEVALLPKNGPFVVEIINEDEVRTKTIKRTIEPWFWPSMVGIGGLIIDSITGKMYAIPKSSNAIFIDFNSVNIPEVTGSSNQKTQNNSNDYVNLIVMPLESLTQQQKGKLIQLQ